jgi:hypothetical protein
MTGIAKLRHQTPDTAQRPYAGNSRVTGRLVLLLGRVPTLGNENDGREVDSQLVFRLYFPASPG